MVPFWKSLGFRLLIISAFLLILPLIVDSLSLIGSYQGAIKDAKAQLIETANLRLMPFSQIQPVGSSSLKVLEHYLKLKTNFPQEKTSELEKTLRYLMQEGRFFNIALIKVNENNQLEYVASGQPHASIKDFNTFFNLITYDKSSIGKDPINYLAYNDLTLLPYFIVTHPVFSDTTNRLQGLLVIWENVTLQLEKLLTPDYTLYPVNFAILLPSSVVFAASDPSLQFQHFEELTPELRTFFLQEEPFTHEILKHKPIPIDTKIGLPFFEFNWKGEKQIGYIKKFPTDDFALLTYASKRSIFTQPFENHANVAAIFALILTGAGALVYFFTKRMTQPIVKLSKTMQEIQNGNLEARYEQDSLGFEINSLGTIFNEMVDDLLEKKHIAEEQRIERETLVSELRVAQRVQRSLLPEKMPSYEGVELAQAYIPAIEVGGDFFDVFSRTKKEGGSQLVLNIADTSGKGVQACFYSLGARSMLRIYAKAYEDVGEVMWATNKLFCQDTGDTGMFVTAVMGIYDHETHQFQYFSSGHNPLIIRRKTGDIEILKNHSIALGVMEITKEPASSIELKKGDLVAFYTDGVTEAHDENNQLFSENRLIEYLKAEGDKSAQRVVEGLLEQIALFRGKAPQFDDITILVMRITD